MAKTPTPGIQLGARAAQPPVDRDKLLAAAHNAEQPSVVPAPQPVRLTTPPPAERAAEPKGRTIVSVDDLRGFVKKREPRVPMTIRVPVSLFDDLQMIQKFGGKTMTDVLVESAAPVVAELMKRIGQKT
jgi:hypothetical protein